MYIYVYLCVFVYMYICIFVCVHMRVCVNIYMSICLWIYPLHPTLGHLSNLLRNEDGRQLGHLSLGAWWMDWWIGNKIR